MPTSYFARQPPNLTATATPATAVCHVPRLVCVYGGGRPGGAKSPSIFFQKTPRPRSKRLGVFFAGAQSQGPAIATGPKDTDRKEIILLFWFVL